MEGNTIMKTNIDMTRVDNLIKLPLRESQREAIAIINECSYKNGAKKMRIIRDIEAANRPREIGRILCYMILAGEGLSVVNAPWQKDFA